MWNTTFNYPGSANPWLCGHTIWEASGQISTELFEERVLAIKEQQYFFQRLRASYDDAIVVRSEDMRIDLQLAGAKGYWPLEGIDFSRVHDLDDKGKQRILKKRGSGTAGPWPSAERADCCNGSKNITWPTAVSKKTNKR